MRSRTVKRIFYFVLAALFLGVAGYEWWQAGFTSDTYVAGGFGVFMGILGVSGTG
jgi:hypothetical protein